MSAYYNEIDEAAAHILRQQIADGVIAPGDVDTRSIKDVQPDDLKGYTQCHFFAGGGLWSVAARLAGWHDDRPLWTGSCPCQPFSAAGKGLGTDDPRHLWPDLYRLIRARRPAVVMGEQVAGKAGYGWFDGVRSDLAREGFTARAIDFPACSVDAPHQRNRLYWVAMAAKSQRRGEGRTLPEVHGGWPTAAVADASGSLDYGVGAGLEGQSRNGDGSGRQEARGPIAEADGASPTGLSPDPAISVIQRQSSTGHQPDNRANAGVYADRCGIGLERQIIALRTGRTAVDGCLGRSGTYWSDAEWIICHDGKARRAKPGLRFLVDGLPGRVGLWRVGGNAIVPQAAAEVIGAFMDVYGEPDRSAA